MMVNFVREGEHNETQQGSSKTEVSGFWWGVV
jgi:hypothetical protein